MTIEELEAHIRAEVDSAKAEGWTIRCDIYSDVARKQCCPMGACARKVWGTDKAKWFNGAPKDDLTIISETIRIERNQAQAVAAGVDGYYCSSGPYADYGALGKRLREVLS